MIISTTSCIFCHIYHYYSTFSSIDFFLDFSQLWGRNSVEKVKSCDQVLVTFWDKSLLYYHDKDFIGNGSPQFGTMIIILLVDIKELYSLLQNLMLLRMAHRLTSHHRALFAPMYFSGTSAHITSSSYFRAPFNVKDKDDFEKRVLSSSKPVLVDFHAEYEVLSYTINYHFNQWQDSWHHTLSDFFQVHSCKA